MPQQKNVSSESNDCADEYKVNPRPNREGRERVRLKSFVANKSRN